MSTGGIFQNYPDGQSNAFGDGSFITSAPDSSFARPFEQPSIGGTSFENILFSDEIPQPGHADDPVIYHAYTEAAPVSANDADVTRQDNLPTETPFPERFVLVRGDQTRIQRHADMPLEGEQKYIRVSSPASLSLANRSPVSKNNCIFVGSNVPCAAAGSKRAETCCAMSEHTKIPKCFAARKKSATANSRTVTTTCYAI